MVETRKPINHTNRLFKERYEKECLRVNVFMKWLMVSQWFAGICFAVFYSPWTWIGNHYEVHVHVWAAILLGGSLSGFAWLWIKRYPKAVHTRHVIATTQMLWSALLIHLTGGRVETHFHVFGSLAILSIYRDWKILITATVVVAIDHFVRGVLYPLSAFGIVTESPFRWIEHAIWILFEVAFLAPGCRRLRNDIRELCVRQTEIEEAKRTVDLKVEERTRDLVQANELLAQKTAEAQKLALVARYTDNAVTITDANAQVEWINEGFTRITGFQLAEIQGWPNSGFNAGEKTCQQTLAELRRAIDNRKGYNAEIISYRKTGEPYWLAIELRPITGKDGQVERFITIQRDISKRKAIELSLAEAEQRLRSLVNNVPGAFFRRPSGHDSRLLFISNSIESIAGYTPADFCKQEGLSIASLIHPDDIKRVNRVTYDAIKSHEPYEVEYRIIDRDHNEKWVWERGQCVNMDSDSNSMVVDSMIFDITDRVAAEQQNRILQAEIVDASRQAGMAEVATGVLHNVGNILNSVNVSASIIQRHYTKNALAHLEKVTDLVSQYESTFQDFVQTDERGKLLPKYLATVSKKLRTQQESVEKEFEDLTKNVEHIKEIIAVQQTMAKSSELRQQLRASEILRDVMTANKESLKSHAIEVEQQLDDPNLAFQSDKHRILQILINLVRNAKDALVEANLGEPKIVLRSWADSANVHFSVADNGIGIEQDKLDQIFQHGFTTKKDGHGFGLHSSANAATEIGGHLSVNSAGIRQGAEFVLTIPVDTSPQSPGDFQQTPDDTNQQSILSVPGVLK